MPSTAPGTPPLVPQRSAPTGLAIHGLFGPFHAPLVPPLFPGAANRLSTLVRDGKLYLSAQDAISLAIENNLDVEIERYNLVLADTDRIRAEGGGNLRGIDYTIQEPPNGVGGPGFAADQQHRNKSKPNGARTDRPYFSERHHPAADQSLRQFYRNRPI